MAWGGEGGACSHPHTMTSSLFQLLRKRHIGNDIVTIIFQESGCQQFSPKWIRSHFQHIFVIIRVENPNTKFTKYRWVWYGQVGVVWSHGWEWSCCGYSYLGGCGMVTWVGAVTWVGVSMWV